MKTTPQSTSFRALLCLFSLLSFALPCHATGSFEYLFNEPTNTIGHIILLSDGTVLASQYDSGNAGTSWYRLTPDNQGRYQFGTWSNIAPAIHDRYYFASAVLKDGRLFVAGGEYGNGAGTTAEIYNPTNNTWTDVSPSTNYINPNQISPSTGNHQTIADAGCKVLPDGRVLIIPAAPKTANGTLIFDPAAITSTNGPWTNGPASLNFLGEGTLLKIPDGSILTVDTDDDSSERYLPALNIWTNDTSTSPTSLWAPLNPNFFDETGPAFLLPNGKAIFFGGIGETALYTPSGGNGPGTWTNGPTIPTNNVTADAPGAMMVNGKILLATSPQPYVTNGTNVIFPSPTTFYEYDYTAPTNTAFTNVVTGLTINAPSYFSQFLDLPDGNVLYSLATTANMFVYVPDGTPLAAGKPTILSISTNGDGSLHFTGTLFNGISEGAAYGDDVQMDSNFPLVRFTDASGNVRYGRTYNWSSTGVMTGNNVVSTDCAAPSGSSSQNVIQVVANGIASDGVLLNPIPVVTTLSDSGPGSLRQVVSNALSGATITFAPGLSGQTITLTSGEVPVNRSVTIDGSALAAGIKINGNHASRIFDIAGGATVTLNSLVISNAYASGGNWGGAIQNLGTLTLSNCTLAGNSTDASGVGGAIYNFGTLTLTGCTLAGNSSVIGGAIENVSSCSVVNCTFATNSVSNFGGGVDNAGGGLGITQCTFVGNYAGVFGGGFDNYLGEVTLVNSIVAENVVDDIYNYPSSTIIFTGNNIVLTFDNAGTPIFDGGIISLNPLLGPLANNGGPTLTMMPQTGSPAIDTGVTADASGITYDQRGPGFPRVLGAAVDIGAVETPVPLIVTTASDSGYGSLRYEATYAPNNSTITFAPALAGQTITLTSGEIPLTQNYAIDGSSLSSPVQLNGNHNSRIFDISGATVVLNSLVISNGYASGGNWGGAIQNSGTLTLNNCTLAANSTDASGLGGAIYNIGSVALAGCTLSGNSAPFAGAIGNYASCSLVNCTLAGNAASSGNGGAIDNDYSATLAVTQCTFSGNSASGSGGGIDNYQSQVTLVNSIVANDSADDIFNWPSSTATFAGTNIVLTFDDAGTPVFDGGIIPLNPMLGPLANNGGPTLTMMPQAGSPAINSGLTSAAAGITYDQRGPGYPRVVGAAVDIGAIEVQVIAASTPYLLTGSALTNGAFGFSFTNNSGAGFTVFGSTNLSLPASNWANLGPAVESPLGSGQFRFIDPQASNSVQRFYRVRSP